MLLEYLKTQYRAGDPIFFSDIEIEGMSDVNLRYQLKKLTDEGEICRFEKGIYYFSKSDAFGESVPLSAQTVAVAKYIMRNGQRFGIYSGFTLANRMGLTTQVPYVEEIISNAAPAPVREVEMGGRRYIIRRPVTRITNDNFRVLQFLECLKDIDKCADESPDVCGEILSEYAKNNDITKTSVDEIIHKYPLKIYKAIYDTGVRYVST